jgi:anti-sigma regulatory factor (Ser/Thr protein kinase)
MLSHLIFRGGCDVRTPAEVRGRLSSALIGAELSPGLVDDVALAATELVTNALRAGAHAIEVELRTDPASLEILVTDDAPGVPTPRYTCPRALNGRGLTIVGALAAQWGFESKDVTKTVWARFGR